MIKIKESNVTIMVNNIGRSVAFYESIGLKLKARWDDHYAMVEAPGVVIGLHPSDENLSESQKISIGFMIDKADDAAALLKQNNIPFERREGGSGIYLNFTDLDGTALYFTEPRWNY